MMMSWEPTESTDLEDNRVGKVGQEPLMQTLKACGSKVQSE